MSKSRLGELIKRAGITHEQLAKLVDASPATLKAIEHGNYDPPLSVAYKLAAALNVSVEKLFSDGDDVRSIGASRVGDHAR